MNYSALELFLRFFSRILMVLLVMPVSRYARALAAKWMGDDTAEREGKLTLNPFVHLDPIGSLLIVLTGFGWGKPMNINPTRMKNYKKGVILVSLAGPVSNIIAGMVCALIYNLMLCSETVLEAAYQESITPVYCILFILSSLFSINISLAVLHLLPIPPMDGFTILRFCAGGKIQQWYYKNQQQYHTISSIVLIAFFLLPSEINPLVYIIGFVQDLLWGSVSWIPGTKWGV